MGLIRQYDPALYVISFAGIRATMLSEGEFVNVERDVDAFAKRIGATGDIVRVRNRNKGGTATVTLLAESPTNDAWSSLALADERLGTGMGVFSVVHLNGTTVCESTFAWVKKFPAVTGSGGEEGAGDRVWVFDLAELEVFVGGAIL